jgi:hypothetical protein
MIYALLLILALSSVTSAVAAPRADVAIGLLLIAVDAQRDHLRISEALRISNPGGETVVDLRITLPPASQYVTFHRGLVRPSETDDGFRDRIRLHPGLTELAYSYAVPSNRRATLIRSFPLPVQRMEIVARGRGISLRAGRGQPLAPLAVAGEHLPRWEVRTVRAGEGVTVVLAGLPVSRPWLPYVSAAILAAALVCGLVMRLVRTSVLRGGVVAGPQNF